MKIDFSIFGRNSVSHIRQAEITECGLACLAMVANYYGSNTDLNKLRRRFPSSSRGTPLKQLINIADDINLDTRPVRLSVSSLHSLALPAILHWDMNHYVVLEKVARNRFLIADPAAGSKRYFSLSELSSHFDGVAIELRPSTKFEVSKKANKPRLGGLWGKIHGWRKAAAQTLILTLILQAFTLASPYYIQISLDSVVPALDGSLLAILSLGFGMFVLFNALASLLRAFVLLSVGTTIGYTLTSNIAKRLVRLPVQWFENRHVGDIISRFQSVQPVQDALTQGVLASLVDGLLAVAILAIMLFYSAKLTALAIGAFIAYVAVRFITFSIERGARESQIITSAEEQSILIETIRGIVTLRLSGRETDRHALWQNKLVAATNSQVSVARISLWQQAILGVIFGVEEIAAIWLGISLVIEGGFSAGMVVAYLAYKQQFLNRARSLIDQGIAFKMLGLHNERLSDIALESEDRSFIKTNENRAKLLGQIELRDVCYSYPASDTNILENLSIDIMQGDYVAITGPSGSGKSTLVKIMLGLVDPTSGEVFVDKMPINRFGIQNYMQQVGAVLQNDSLFAGSILENITSFDQQPDMSFVQYCADMAAIHSDIMDMPMKYDTLLGDMGASISGGQKARILISRALYKRPSILLLDEGTAHLDEETENIVNKNVSALGITRIIVAHRSETIKSANKVYYLHEKRLKLVK